MTRAALLSLIVLVGCHGPGPGLLTPSQRTPESEALAGALAAPGLEARHGGVLRDAQAEQRMQRIGSLLCQGTHCLEGDYRYRLLDSDAINAFSLPGGRVYVTRGLYERLVNDDFLAAVLAHEMAHIESRDHFKRRCRERADALQREVAADALATDYLRAADIAPEAMGSVIRTITDALPPGWSVARVDSVARYIDEMPHGG